MTRGGLPIGRSGVPEFDRGVVIDGGQGAAVGGEGDGAGLAGQAGPAVAGRHVPEFHVAGELAAGASAAADGRFLGSRKILAKRPAVYL